MNGTDYEKNSFSLNVTVENTYKKEDEIILKRNKRKSFIKANGIKNYGFDFDKEFNKYLFLCGEKIKKRNNERHPDNSVSADNINDNEWAGSIYHYFYVFK